MIPLKAKQFFILFIVTLLSFALPACSTVKGAGKDLEKLGKIIQGNNK